MTFRFDGAEYDSWLGAMIAPSTTLSDLIKVVVALMKGPRLRGYVYNFSALRDSFHLLPPENPLQQRGTEVALKDVKAIFFVKDFGSHRQHRPNTLAAEFLAEELPNPGRKIEVTFADGEKLVGTTVAYNPQKPGFFMFPADSESNNQRIFVINKNAQGVRFF